MPQASRRTTRSSAPAKQQSKIAFANKVTKRTDSFGKDGKSDLVSRSKLNQVEAAETKKPEVVTLDDNQNDVVIKVGRKGDVEEVNEQEAEAKKLDDKAIKKYWRERENERLAPRVHQEEVSMEEKILRLFDMSSQYGPCIGIPRLARWHRAHRLGLEPPIEVLAVMVRENKGVNLAPKAHFEELLATKGVAEN